MSGFPRRAQSHLGSQEGRLRLRPLLDRRQLERQQEELQRKMVESDRRMEELHRSSRKALERKAADRSDPGERRRAWEKTVTEPRTLRGSYHLLMMNNTAQESHGLMLLRDRHADMVQFIKTVNPETRVQRLLKDMRRNQERWMEQDRGREELWKDIEERKEKQMEEERKRDEEMARLREQEKKKREIEEKAREQERIMKEMKESTKEEERKKTEMDKEKLRGEREREFTTVVEEIAKKWTLESETESETD